MTKRSINTSIEELLVSNSEFEYAHLIKFERPFAKDPEVQIFVLMQIAMLILQMQVVI